ncbi:SNF2-related protein [Lentisalinibacter sediminis]|uniref:SNF2-related protein n=1 Tax=Lentisalinibacter sediminis TaxID=2992237 RepID=UPI00386D1127
MPNKKPQTADLFATPASSALAGDWPPAARFPLNHDAARVADTVLRDLAESRRPLIVTGYSTLDRIIDFVATADRCEEIRVLFGTEPFESRRDSFTLADRELPEEIRDYWLERGISVRLSAKLLLTIERLRTGAVRARHLSRGGWRLHAKIYVGDSAAALGSSNFSDSGLRHQLEANVRFECRDDTRDRGAREENRRYQETVDIAEQYWALGRDYNDELIALLEQLLRLVTWQEALARAAAELLEAEWAQRYLRGEYLPGDASLWPSQRSGIAQALYILKERGSVLIADATGSGKTRTGVHLIGAKMHEIIASNRLRRGKVLLICPPAVMEEWQDESARASVHLDVFSHGKLSRASNDPSDTLLTNLRRAQMLCVDEGHNFLNFTSNRTQQLLRNMADHVALFTATPINRSAVDLLRIADMLGADNLDDSTVEAFGRMLGARSLSRTLSEEEIAELRREIAKFTVRRTKRMLNQLIAKQPEAYTDARGRPCRFPKHRASTYPLNESPEDRDKAQRIRELTDNLKGVLWFRRDIKLPAPLKRRGMTEERFLAGRLRGANKLAQYSVMSALRSSRAALFEHLLGTDAAAARANLEGFTKNTRTGDVIGRVEDAAGHPPRSRLSIPLPDWLADKKAHRRACEEEIAIYREIAAIAETISAKREHAKVQRLAELSNRFEYILAFDSRPITLAVIRMLLENLEPGPRILVATGDTQSDRSALLRAFSPKSDDPRPTIGLCSDSIAEGVNLQRAQALVHLDMPSVVRIAEQRAGRIDRLDSPHDAIHAWWPEDAAEFALRADERFIERYDTVDNLLGSNMPLPESIRGRSGTFTARQAIREFETRAGSWDGIDDAFSPVRSLISGDTALIPDTLYDEYTAVSARVLSRVSLVSTDEPWAFFCTRDATGVPRWILLPGRDEEPVTDLFHIAERLRERLGADTRDLSDIPPRAEALLQHFLERLAMAERSLLSRRKKRALEEMHHVLAAYRESAASRSAQREVDTLTALLRLLEEPTAGDQPDWEELSARWLDLIRPVWYQKLQERGRRKPLLLRDIRKDLIAAEATLLPRVVEEFSRAFPAQRPADERIVACVVGVDAP